MVRSPNGTTVPDHSPHQRRLAVRAAMRRSSFDLIALWARYVALGGSAGADTVGRYLNGESCVTDDDVDLLLRAAGDDHGT